MTKSELITKIAGRTGIEKVTVSAVIESMMGEVKESVISNESVFLRGFGTFKAKKRAEKAARNIKKNTTIIVPSHYIPAFKPAKSFVNSTKTTIK